MTCRRMLCSRRNGIPQCSNSEARRGEAKVDDHRERGLIGSDGLVADARIERDGGIVAFYTQAESIDSLGATLIVERVKQGGADAAVAVVGHDSNGDLGCSFVNEAIAR